MAKFKDINNGEPITLLYKQASGKKGVHYNFACSLSLVGKPKEALEELKKAVLFGYDDFSYIDKDGDLDNLRKLPEFKSFFAKLKKLKK